MKIPVGQVDESKLYRLLFGEFRPADTEQRRFLGERTHPKDSQQ
jgi:hypothetical protein